MEFCGQKDAFVKRVGIACGSAGEYLNDAIAADCDTFVTGEARFHTVLEAQSCGVSLILMGHYSSERPAMEWLAGELGRQFAGVDVWASQSESDPFRLSMKARMVFGKSWMFSAFRESWSRSATWMRWRSGAREEPSPVEEETFARHTELSCTKACPLNLNW